jgi:hypothetical protein
VPLAPLGVRFAFAVILSQRLVGPSAHQRSPLNFVKLFRNFFVFTSSNPEVSL